MNLLPAARLSLTLACMSPAAQAEPQFSGEQIKKGSALFAWHCATCHGTRMRNPQWAIDLREFPRDARARFVESVTYGKRNMPPWEDALNPEEIEALWAYVREGDPGD